MVPSRTGSWSEVEVRWLANAHVIILAKNRNVYQLSPKSLRVDYYSSNYPSTRTKSEFMAALYVQRQQTYPKDNQGIIMITASICMSLVYNRTLTHCYSCNYTFSSSTKANSFVLGEEITCTINSCMCSKANFTCTMLDYHRPVSHSLLRVLSGWKLPG